MATHVKLGAEIIDLLKVQFTPELLRCIPAETALKYRVLPVSITPNRLAVAFSQISEIDLSVIDSLCSTLKREIEIRLADEHQLDICLRRFYKNDDSAI
jgi:hypothetical protein